jgi:hypothetical protein
MTTRLPIPKERLEQTLAHCKRETPENMAPISAGSAVEIIGALLAAHEQEPVAYMYRDNLHTDARFSLDPRFGNWSPEDISEYEISETPLYTHPAPVPAVPDEMEDNGNPHDEEDMAYVRGWNACRAAMLNGADVSLKHEGKNHSEDNLDMVDHSGSDTEMVNLPVTGWLRADYCDDNRRGDAPLFVLGNKDPSSACDVKYIPLSAMLNGGKS